MKQVKVSSVDSPPNMDMLIVKLCELFLENKKVTAKTVENQNNCHSYTNFSNKSQNHK